MNETVLRLLGALGGARSFEEASTKLLVAALDVVEGALASSAYGKGRIVCAMAHVRPDDGYRGLVAIDAGARGARGALRRSSAAHVPSATAWKWLVERGQPVAVDVLTGDVTIASGEAAGSLTAQKLDAQRSQAKLVQRDVTHLFVVPLPAPHGRVDGMLAIEASCQAAIGEPFVWGACRADLEVMAAIAAPFLTRLPVSAAEVPQPDELLPVIGGSMAPVIEMLRVFAAQEETLLLGGPTGAGKTRLARWCHERSAVKAGPFETIDLATIPEDLQMADLFGWRKGAFTGAAKDTTGAMARAEGGTLLIDEIDKLSLRVQAGLLRVLEEKKYRTLGDGLGDRTANVRFVVGTNADLLSLVRKGAFREDLYYRVNVLPVRVPALRERRDEIEGWATFMLRRRHSKAGDATLGPKAAQILAAHDWPGNLRQLDNIVRRAYALCMSRAAPNQEVICLEAQDVQFALDFEGETRAAPAAWEHLERAADAFAAEAERRVADNQEKLDMDVAEGFKGLVIEAARRRAGGDEKEALRTAYVRLGKESVVESRNHGAHCSRELKKLDEARRAFGLPVRSRAEDSGKNTP